MSWWLLVLAGAGLWLFVAICAVSLAVAAGRADERHQLDELGERRERDRWLAQMGADDVLDELANEVEARARARVSRSA